MYQFIEEGVRRNARFIAQSHSKTNNLKLIKFVVIFNLLNIIYEIL